MPPPANGTAKRTTSPSSGVVATSVRVSPAPATDSVVLDFGVTVSPIWGNPEPPFLSFGALRSPSLKPPFRLGEVKIQP